MILLDKPYISEFVKQTIREYNLTAIKTSAAQEFCTSNEVNWIEEAQAVERFRSNPDTLIYTTSENAIDWIARHLDFTDLPAKIELFKNKAKFRALLQHLHPDFFYREIPFEELDSVSTDDLRFPLVIKPNTGFFSLGVHIVSTPPEWDEAKAAIREEFANASITFPVEVLNTSSFIVEEIIEGDEFAFDAYFDKTGEPVVLGIYQHIFSSEKDVKDRIYISSKDIIEAHIDQFRDFLAHIGNLTHLKNFAVHVEVRIDKQGKLMPIEVNPMRFGGWCTTADMTALAYGFNPYVYYLTQQRPNWGEILAGKTGKLYSMVILDNSTGIPANQISGFDYESLLTKFEHPLELRKIDVNQFPLFGFLFLETSAKKHSELDYILKSDLKEFVIQ